MSNWITSADFFTDNHAGGGFVRKACVECVTKTSEEIDGLMQIGNGQVDENFGRHGQAGLVGGKLLSVAQSSEC